MLRVAAAFTGLEAFLTGAALLSGGAAIAAFVAAAVAATSMLYGLAGDKILPEGEKRGTAQERGRRRNLFNSSLVNEKAIEQHARSVAAQNGLSIEKMREGSGHRYMVSDGTGVVFEATSIDDVEYFLNLRVGQR